MAISSVKFDQRGLRALEPREKTYSVSDPKTPGLTLRVTPNGSKTYFYVYRMGGRKSAKKWLKVAAFEDLPLNRAQEQARAYRAQVDAGTNPAEVLKAKATVGTKVEDLAIRFKRDYLPHLAPKTQEGYTGSIDKHILPGLGKVPLLDLDRSRVIAWHGKIEGPRAANLALAVLSCMLTQAMLWGLRPEGINPCAHVQRNPEVPRARDIREDELIAIGKALRALEGRHTVWALAAIKVIALCWGRESEVLGLRRDKDCFLDEGYAIIRTHKTSRKQGAKHMVLVPQVVEILKALPEQVDNPHFFVGTLKDGAPLSRHTLYKTWRAVCEEAQVSDLHIHDFRSLAASEGEAQGVSPKTMAHLLGHSDNLTAQEVLVAGMLRPEHLLDLIRHFIAFKIVDGKTIKIVARYQQFRAVREAVRRLLEGQVGDRSRGIVDRRGGIVWHTQGSGTRTTMHHYTRIRAHRVSDVASQVAAPIARALEGSLEPVGGDSTTIG